jgi:hypothetical protein
MRKIVITESQLKKLVENNGMEQNYMFFSNLEQIERQCKLLREIDPSIIEELLNNGHDWADDHVTEAKVNLDQVFDFIMNETKGHHNDQENVSADLNQFSLNEDGKMQGGEKDPCWKGYHMVGKKMKNGKEVPNCVPKSEAKEEKLPYDDEDDDTKDVHPSGTSDWRTKNESQIIKLTSLVISEIKNEEYSFEDELGPVEETNFIADDLLNEAEYQGRKVQLGKIMQGDVKKFKVYVKNDKGKVVKVNFGFGGSSAHGKVMKIKKNNPERRKSFRARMKCDNPGPRWKPRYWACRTW